MTQREAISRLCKSNVDGETFSFIVKALCTNNADMEPFDDTVFVSKVRNSELESETLHIEIPNGYSHCIRSVVAGPFGTRRITERRIVNVNP